MNEEVEIKEYGTCPHCNNGILELIIGYEPYTDDYLQCDNCYSTYCIINENKK